MTRLTVKSHRPIQWSISIILLSMFIALLTWLMLDKSHWSVIHDRISINRKYNGVVKLNRDLEFENSRLRGQLVMMEKMASLDKKTASILQDDIKTMQEEIFQLNGELKFYQGIMDATRDIKGLNIHGIYIQPLRSKKNYRLKLVLTNVTKGINLASGTMDITIEGVLNGTEKHLQLQQIALNDTLDLSFKFRNFHRFESRLELPEGFNPRRVTVQLLPNSKKQAKIKRVFDWFVSTSWEK